MPTRTRNGRTFDARPDRVDLRDRIYQPKLVSLPHCFPDIDSMLGAIEPYAKQFVLDQGTEGACTGFGLAAVVNYLQWRNNSYAVKGLDPVSPRMLYHLARIYDEWPGEDYEGSSCRGAMKGWHRHGACTDALWPYRNAKGEVAFVAPKSGWDSDAAMRPLGAYYRVDAKSISDMQAALHEVGAVYASANVHNGWFLKRAKTLPLIKMDSKIVGGHAFAITGYNEDGFIVQNSWGPGWGYHGFAVLTYEDWALNGDDAWVAVLGAPMRVAAGASAFRAVSLQGTVGAGAAKPSYSYRDKRAEPLSESAAYLHALVMGNDGAPINRILVAENAAAAVRHASFELPKQWLASLPAQQSPKLAIYVHGGLNSEEASIKRARMMAPYFLANGIYPLFITWKSGAMETVGDILSDSTREIFRGQPDMRDEGIADKIRDKLAEARDRSIEVATERLLVKPMWSQMKQNAEAAAAGGGGTALLAAALAALKKQFPALELHLAGHSAGSIVLGHLLPLLDPTLKVSTLSLMAPACTVGFAVQRYGDAIAAGRVAASAVHVDLMDDERELADTVGPYGKSLLYLVSRALETRHKMPILGMEWAWKANPPEDKWAGDADSNAALAAWLAIAKPMTVRYHDRKRQRVPTGTGTIPLAHGSFDNDIEVVTKMLERMRGGALALKVENLAY
jgi:hypothetical protein